MVAKRDEHLKRPDFFGAKQFPTIAFKGSRVKKVDDTAGVTDTMFTPWELFAAIVLPAAVSVLVLVAGWRVTRHWYSSRESRSWAGPPAVTLAFAAAWLALFGWTGLPPHDAIDWLLPVTLPLVLLGLLESYYRWPPPAGVLAIAVAVATTLLVISWPLLGASRDDGLSGRLLLATTLAMLTLIPLDLLAQRLSFGRMSTILFVVGAPAAVTLGCSGSARLGLIATVLAATQAGGVAAGVVLGRSATARGVVLVFGSLLAGLLWSGYAYASLSAIDGMLLAVAPSAAWLGRWAPRRFGWSVNFATQVGAVLAVALIPAVRAWLAFRESGLY